MAVVYGCAGQFEKGFNLIAEVLQEDPNEHQHRLSLYRLYRSSGQYNKALKAIGQVKKAIAPRQLSEQNLSSESYCNLSAGKYVKGLQFLKDSWDKGTEKTALGWHQRKYKYDAWAGDDLTGRTILVHCEQGLGDGIIFLRYLPLLATMNPAKVILALAKPLHRLVANNPHIDEVIDSKGQAPKADVQVFTFDLPLHFKSTSKTIPAPASLNIPTSSKARAEKILAPYQDTFKLGVLWTGNPKFPQNKDRSFPIQRFLELADIEGLQMFSLYKGNLPKVMNTAPAKEQILDVSNTDKDLADSAALIEQLDLVITIDSAVAHLSGSLSTPVWCLLKFLPFWYYANGRKTPWYPDMRLFKQESPRQWGPVFEDVRRQLERTIALHKT